MIKSKKQSLIVIGVFTLVLALVTTTYAFFNYTRTGTGNTIRVGRISFVSKNEETISLNNLFPIDPSNTSDLNDNTKVGTYSIDIKGDTDYVDGIEYLVSAVDANIYTSQGQIVPISLDVTVTDLGDPSTNYFTVRESTNASIYKKLVGDTLVGDQMLLVGYIKPNPTSGTAEGVNGKLTIKAYLDKNKILISDTYDGSESDNMGTPNSMAQGKTILTTTEWNSLQSSGVSFKVKVEANEGIWVNGSLEEIMRKENLGVDTEQGVDFSKTSNEDETKGVYLRAGTQNDTYPILYYRGAVENNNVIFANKCWQMVRTTDTGGVKLIYNGETGHVYKDDNYDLSLYDNVTRTGNQFEFDVDTKEWKVLLNAPISGEGSGEANIKFTVAEPGNYVLKFNNLGSGPITATRDGVSLNPVSGVNEIALNNLTTSEEINIAYTHYGVPGTQSMMTVALNKGQIDMGIGCKNTGKASQITLNIEGTDTDEFRFNTSNDSPVYNGYMYGTVYTYSSGVENGAYYDGTFVWDGEKYKLTDAATTTMSDNAHYSCGQTTKEATCTSLRYYYCTYQYITLTGGDGIEEAIAKMNTNTNDSNVKEKIDTWYASNMISVTNKLEDTIWCNDRSFGDGNNNGWIANGGDLSTYLYYGAYQRSNQASGSSTVKNQPSLTCVNKNDRFTVSNGNGNQALNYPVGMLTEDEIILAGGVGGKTNGSFYLTTGKAYWSLSPYGFINNNISVSFMLYPNGYIESEYYVVKTNGIRPSISIKPGQLITKGIGTVADPYVIE